MDPKTPIHLYSGKTPGHNSATGFPVRSHHLSGLLEWTAVKGELPHLTNPYLYSIAAAAVNTTERHGITSSLQSQWSNVNAANSCDLDKPAARIEDSFTNNLHLVMKSTVNRLHG